MQLHSGRSGRCSVVCCAPNSCSSQKVQYAVYTLLLTSVHCTTLLPMLLHHCSPDVNEADSAIAAGAVSDLTALPATPEALLESDDVSDDVSALSGESLTNQNLNPERRVMVAQVQVLSVELALVADPVEHETGAARELLYLKLAGLALQVEKRPFDLAVTVGLSELSLEDMSRPADSGLRRMAHSSAAQSSGSQQHKRSSSSSSSSEGSDSSEQQQQLLPTHLILVRYTAASDARSPLTSAAGSVLRGHDAAAQLQFSTLALSLNSSCLDTLTPFYRAITRAPLEGGTTANASATDASTASVTEHERWTTARTRSRSHSVASGGGGLSEQLQQRLAGRQQQQQQRGAGPPKSILVELSVTEVSLELVMAHPHPQPVLRAAVTGLQVCCYCLHCHYVQAPL
jgi:hypothetical protein